MSVDMNQFQTVFFDESVEHLQTMEELLLNLSTDDPDPEDLNSIFRAAHSIKGGSGIFGFDALTGLTHVMETLLDKARNNELDMTTEIVDTFLATCDTLNTILQAYRDETEIDWEAIEAGKARLNEILGSHESASEQAKDEGFGFFDDDPVSASDDDDGFGFFDDEPATAEAKSDDIEGFGFFDDEPAKESVEVKEDAGFGFFDNAPGTSPEPPMEGPGYGFFKPLKSDSQESKKGETTTKTATDARKAAAPAAAKDSASIRVDTIKIDSVVNLVGEMVITQSMLRNIGMDVDGITGDKLMATIDDLSRNIREIQEAVMSMRMLPVSFVFNRFPRLVRDLAGKLNKKIDLVIEGGNTEVDKSMIEKLADPLTHLVRNSLDHGIESADKRAERGKPEVGTITLRAEQRGSNILISIKDDGGGLHRERILDKARNNGLSVSDSMTDKEVWKLIFEPGFSTAEAVTDVSGRGVGMDVVRKNIEAIKGGIDIESRAGEGATFTIRLPLTLAIVDGMCVGVGDQTLVIPLLNIIESVQPDKSQIKSLGNDSMLWSRDQYWPLMHLGKTLCIEDAEQELTKAIIVLVEVNNKRYGIVVDQLLGEQQVVIKNLERHYKKVDGISGATIMGDGQVALILDVDNLIDDKQLQNTEQLR